MGQEGERAREEALREHHQGLDPVFVEGPEGAELEGLRGGVRQERPGQGLVREGEVFLLALSHSLTKARKALGLKGFLAVKKQTPHVHEGEGVLWPSERRMALSSGRKL